MIGRHSLVDLLWPTRPGYESLAQQAFSNLLLNCDVKRKK